MITSVIEKNTEKKSNEAIFHVLSALCLVLTFFASYYLYKTIQNQIKQSLLDRVNTVALTLDPEEFVGLTAVAEDEETEAYKKIKKKLINLYEINPDVRYFYIAAMRDDNVYFLADSEYEDADYGPPGQLYAEASDLYKSMFYDEPLGYFEVGTDRWGTWATAFAVIPSEENQVKYVMGIDIEAKDYIRTPIYFASIPYITFLSAYFVILFILRKRRGEMDLLYTKNRFLAIASHELRAPLTGIRWSSEILKNAPSLAPTEKKVATDINTSSINLIKIVNELLDVFTIESKLVDVKKFAPLDMIPTIREAIKQMSAFALEKNIFISFNSNEETTAGKLMVKAEETRMYTVLTNVISNAIKYSNPNSEVIISISQYKKMVRIRVKDAGIGIPAQAIDKVTKGFFRAENALKTVANGTGLGLYLVDTIVRLHEGTLKIESEIDKGTTVTIDLPLSE
ncbi:MAG: HAMP domain-containing sensor histidine kinase [Patescibacteria group bacterium]